jgi:hypothetical protein
MNKFWMIILFLIVFTGCSEALFKTVSKGIDKKTRTERVNKPLLTFHEVRMKVYKQNEAAFLQNVQDTLYLIEKYDLENITYYSEIWNKDHHLAYQYRLPKGKITYDVFDVFPKQIFRMIEKWDTAAMRRAGENADMHPSNNIYATRVIMKDNNKRQIDVISVKDFFMPDRH